MLGVASRQPKMLTSKFSLSLHHGFKNRSVPARMAGIFRPSVGNPLILFHPKCRICTGILGGMLSYQVKCWFRSEMKNEFSGFCYFALSH